MRALSIRQPWAWAILHAGKRVENRVWKAAPRFMVGQTFLIHAAAGCTRDEYIEGAYTMRSIARMVGRSPWPKDVTRIPALAEMTRGALVGRARLVAAVRTTEMGHRVAERGPIVCELCGGGAEAIAECECPLFDPWAVSGALGLILDDVQPLPAPIPFKGALGFFDVPDSILEAA